MENTRAWSRAMRRGGCFHPCPPRDKAAWKRVSGMGGDGWTKNGLEVCDNSRTEMCVNCHTHTYSFFLITILWTRPRVCSLQMTPRVSFLLHRENETKQNAWKPDKISFQAECVTFFGCIILQHCKSHRDLFFSYIETLVINGFQLM